MRIQRNDLFDVGWYQIILNESGKNYSRFCCGMENESKMIASSSFYPWSYLHNVSSHRYYLLISALHPLTLARDGFQLPD